MTILNLKQKYINITHLHLTNLHHLCAIFIIFYTIGWFWCLWHMYLYVFYHIIYDNKWWMINLECDWLIIMLDIIKLLFIVRIILFLHHFLSIQGNVSIVFLTEQHFAGWLKQAWYFYSNIQILKSKKWKIIRKTPVFLKKSSFFVIYHNHLHIFLKFFSHYPPRLVFIFMPNWVYITMLYFFFKTLKIHVLS